MEDIRIHKRSKILHEVDKISNLKEMLQNTRKKYGNENAFAFKTETPDVFRYYLDEIDSFGTALIDMGLKGKRIAVISENRYDWMVSYLAVVCGVGIVSPLDKSLPEEELISSINRSQVEAIIYSSKYEDIMCKINGEALNKFDELDKVHKKS